MGRRNPLFGILQESSPKGFKCFSSKTPERSIGSNMSLFGAISSIRRVTGGIQEKEPRTKTLPENFPTCSEDDGETAPLSNMAAMIEQRHFSFGLVSCSRGKASTERINKIVNSFIYCRRKSMDSVTRSVVNPSNPIFILIRIKAYSLDRTVPHLHCCRCWPHLSSD